MKLFFKKLLLFRGEKVRLDLFLKFLLLLKRQGGGG
jgi:hypothetical protein